MYPRGARSTSFLCTVHGAGHGAWCWFKLLCVLQGSGHRVSCVDLAGAAGSRVDPNAVRSFDEYDAPLLDLMAALPDGEKVILVGHSAGGLSVTHAMHLFGDRIKQAIFIAATMLPFGYQTEQDIKDADRDRMGMPREHFVLVHGEGHGGWCWFKLRWLLEGSGYRVTCVDLAGGGVDPTDPNTVRSFEQYDKPLFDLISALPEGEKVILVGHSTGGLCVIHAMHEFIHRIRQAIFVAATMLPFGLQTDDDKKDGLPILPENEIELTFAAGADEPPTAAALRPEFQRDRLSQQSPEEESILASMLMRPWPVTAICTASFEGDDERLNRIKRVFIKTERDHMLDPQQQDSMIKKWPPSEVLVIDTDHSPFFSAPEQLFNLIVKSL